MTAMNHDLRNLRSLKYVRFCSSGIGRLETVYYHAQTSQYNTWIRLKEFWRQGKNKKKEIKALQGAMSTVLVENDNNSSPGRKVQKTNAKGEEERAEDQENKELTDIETSEGDEEGLEETHGQEIEKKEDEEDDDDN